MSAQTSPQPAAPATLQTVLDRLARDPNLSDSRRRDLRSAVTSYAKVRDLPPAALTLDLADMRRTLDTMVPARAKVSAKRWANLRSDLAGAIAASGLRPMLKTADLDLDEEWAALLVGASRRLREGLSRFGRWASLRRIRPLEIDNGTIDRFVAELKEGTLVHNLRFVARSVARTWNALVAVKPDAGLRGVAMPATRRVPNHIPWVSLPPPLQQDIDAYTHWAAMPDPLAEDARKRALAPGTLRLLKMQIVAAVTAAVATGIPLDRITSLAKLVEPDTFRAILRQRWRQDGSTLTFYTHNGACTLIAIASDWVKAPAETVAALKALRAKLGMLPSGLTEKNRATLRAFDDPRLIAGLVQLPDRLWHAARRSLSTSRRRSFIDLQSALAIDLLLHVPLRLQNLASLKFGVHLHWPQGQHKPALLTFGEDETKNDVVLEFEVPTVLADRLWAYRNEIAPAVIGERPQVVFVALTGRPRKSETVKITIKKTIQRYLGVKLTPQFRHLAAKIILDNNPGAFELVRQLLGHKNLRTTTNFYAGIDTRRAGRAHAELVMRLRESSLSGARRRRAPRPAERDRHGGQ